MPAVFSYYTRTPFHFGIDVLESAAHKPMQGGKGRTICREIGVRCSTKRFRYRAPVKEIKGGGGGGGGGE